eukprot:12389-Lingulodinium_polyedra.AAC.1
MVRRCCVAAATPPWRATLLGGCSETMARLLENLNIERAPQYPLKNCWDAGEPLTRNYTVA